MKSKRLSLLMPMGLTLSALLIGVGCGGGSSSSSSSSSPNDAALKFPSTPTSTFTVTVDGTEMTVDQYRVVYCAKPIKMALSQASMQGSITLNDPYEYQTMYISVPRASANNQKTAIYFRVNNGGWMASRVDSDQFLIKSDAAFTPSAYVDGDLTRGVGDAAAVGSALKAGYVVVDVGSRSRTGCLGADGTWQGKSPAPVVDAKAAIRYLKLNDKVIPGSSERIFVTGTSGGGGLTAQIAASGNSADYYPYLAEIGAAGIVGEGAKATSTLKDDIFAAVAYCPINNLGNADAGYEWQFNAIRTDLNTSAINSVAYTAGAQLAASEAIAPTFPTYLNALKLTTDGSTLVTDANLNTLTAALVEEEVVRQVVAGKIACPLAADGSVSFSVPGFGSPTSVPNTWLTVAGTQAAPVVTIDFTKFLQFVAAGTQLKSVVAFDSFGVTGNTIPARGGESNLFGAANLDYSNFMEWAWNNNSGMADSVGEDNTGLAWTDYLATSAGQALAKQIKLINPEAYLNTNASVAPYWYIRHGGVDRDTSFAMQTMLYYAVKNNTKVKDLNFKYPWLTPHSGNYDVNEAFTWIKAKVAAAN